MQGPMLLSHSWNERKVMQAAVPCPCGIIIMCYAKL
jgi:hypothetical protein